jgi:alpha-L-fucosidase
MKKIHAKNDIFLTILLLICFTVGCKETIITPPVMPPAINTHGGLPMEKAVPYPSQIQLDWQNSEMALFIHFGMNTFTGKEWGDGTENPLTFAPATDQVNVTSWVSLAKEAGFKNIILTVKHHDGFCLWPSKYTTHSIKYSSYQNGKGDLVKEFADACRTQGLKFSFYLSPWDEHEPTYGTVAYNTYYWRQLIELLTNYGEVGEVWFDGANGGSTVPPYDWNLFYSTVRYYQPNAIMAVMGPDVRWIGNEEGVSPDTNWSKLTGPMNIIQPSYDGKIWWPTECDVSIRPGWFYHPYEDFQIRSLENLISIYFKSVGRNSNLLLNIPPDKTGDFAPGDVERIKEWRNALNNIFVEDLFSNATINASNTRYNDTGFSAKNTLDQNRQTFWTTDKDTTTAELLITMNSERLINIIKLEEAIEFGQRISSFSVYASVNGAWQRLYNGATIGRTKLVTFPPVTTSKIRIVIESASESPTLCTIGGYYSELAPL